MSGPGLRASPGRVGLDYFSKAAASVASSGDRSASVQPSALAIAATHETLGCLVIVSDSTRRIISIATASRARPTSAAVSDRLVVAPRGTRRGVRGTARRVPHVWQPPSGYPTELG